MRYIAIKDNNTFKLIDKIKRMDERLLIRIIEQDAERTEILEALEGCEGFDRERGTKYEVTVYREQGYVEFESTFVEVPSISRARLAGNQLWVEDNGELPEGIAEELESLGMSYRIYRARMISLDRFVEVSPQPFDLSGEAPEEVYSCLS